MDNELEQLKARIADLEQTAARNAAKISKDRHQRKNWEMAIYIGLAVAAVLAIGYKRQEEGTWSWQIPTEITLAVLGGGGLLYKMMENPDQD